ncbi:MAG: (Fe-S)-binding protein [Desulfurococcales archaeon]|jgi:Fe-S oxidoreductase|nr:(Fe-S)-binding protein [Desulfurococcales archaeon]
MPLKLVDVVSMIRDNMKSTGNPLGIDPRICSSWAEGLDLPRGGSIIIYTSCMYQSIPYIVELTNLLERVEGAPSAIISLGRALARIVNVAELVGRSAGDLGRYLAMVRNIAIILRRQGVNIGYLYEEEPYSGALLYELGMEEEFAEHVRRVIGIFREKGVRKTIAVDPHTYYVLSKIYPRYIEGFDIEVSHYLEILNPSMLGKGLDVGEVVIHDPCLLARFMGIIDNQRRVLEGLGVRYKEPVRSGKRTRCCGGPLESISPRLSRRIGGLRAEELASIGEKVVVLCPICFSNLSRISRDYGLEVIDLSEILVQ